MSFGVGCVMPFGWRGECERGAIAKATIPNACGILIGVVVGNNRGFGDDVLDQVPGVFLFGFIGFFIQGIGFAILAGEDTKDKSFVSEAVVAMAGFKQAGASRSVVVVIVVKFNVLSSCNGEYLTCGMKVFPGMS